MRYRFRANTEKSYLSKPVRQDELLDMLCDYLPEYLFQTKERAETEGHTGIHKEKEDDNVEKEIAQRFPMLDTKAGLGYCMEDEEFYVEMIETYVEGDKRKLLADAYDAEDWETYETYVHSLKSTSLNIGADMLSGHAKALEFAAKDGNYTYIKEHHDAVMEEYTILLDGLKKELA